MKYLITLCILSLTSVLFGQSKYDYVQYNLLTEIEGTEYVVASMNQKVKVSGSKTNNKFLLFINTETGNQKRVDFPGEGYLGYVAQTKIDSLKINYVIVEARTVDLDGKNGIVWSDPRQLFILSVDGEEKYQVTEDNYFLTTWKVNQTTGKLVATGYFDSNNNGKFDKGDRNEVLIVDLQNLESKP